MTDNCMICGKHLSSKLAKTEGVGPECKHGFSRKIRHCMADTVEREYIEGLFDELEYDIVVTSKEVWWQTDEAPYLHSITHNHYSAPRVLEDECNVTVTALEELLRMYGYKKIMDVPYPSYMGVSALQALHTHDREPFWFSIFDAKELDRLVPSECWLDNMLDIAYEYYEDDFFPEMMYRGQPPLGLHRLVSLADRIGGREGFDTLEHIFWYNHDEDAEIRYHEQEMCKNAFERGDLYWGKLQNNLLPVTILGEEIGDRAFTPAEAEEVMLRVIPEFPNNGDDAEDYFNSHHFNLQRILEGWIRERPRWHERVRGLRDEFKATAQ